MGWTPDNTRFLRSVVVGDASAGCSMDAGEALVCTVRRIDDPKRCAETPGMAAARNKEDDVVFDENIFTANGTWGALAITIVRCVSKTAEEERRKRDQATRCMRRRRWQ